MDIARKYNDGHWNSIMRQALQGKLISKLRSKDHACKKVIKLLQAGADARYQGKVYLNSQSFVASPPLCTALKNTCKHCKLLLIKKIDKIDINEALSGEYFYESTYEESSPLRKAIINKLPEDIRQCLEARKECVNEKYGSLDSTPLLLAATSDCIESVKILLEYGALVNREMLACPWIDNKIIELLRDQYIKQTCSLCHRNQDRFECSLELMPCAEYHPGKFLCGECYEEFWSNSFLWQPKPCPVCRRDLKIYPPLSDIYKSWL